MSGTRKITLPKNSPAKWAWLAGILEGEGCFIVQPKRNYPSIALAMKDHDIVRRAADIMGCNRIWLANNASHHGIWKCAVQGQRALLIIDRIYNLLGQRRKAKVDILRRTALALPGQTRGERSPNAKLDDNTVRLIHNLYYKGVFQRQIAAQVGVTQATISRVLRGVGWKHLSRLKTKRLLETQRRQAAIQCRNGHLRTKLNTVLEKTGWTRCLDCKKAADAKYRATRRVEIG